MKTIYKYPFEVKDVVKIKVKALEGITSFKDQLLNIDVQNGTPCLWCLVDKDAPEWEVTLRIVGTGHPCDDVSKTDFLGSFMMFEGSLVFHVFCIGAVSL